jgi:hypothetical protein
MIVIELKAVIREIPYGFNSQFSPDKGCLRGTRMAFLDFIIDWVNIDIYLFNITMADSAHLPPHITSLQDNS